MTIIIKNLLPVLATSATAFKNLDSLKPLLSKPSCRICWWKIRVNSWR